MKFYTFFAILSCGYAFGKPEPQKPDLVPLSAGSAEGQVNSFRNDNELMTAVKSWFSQDPNLACDVLMRSVPVRLHKHVFTTLLGDEHAAPGTILQLIRRFGGYTDFVDCLRATPAINSYTAPGDVELIYSELAKFDLLDQEHVRSYLLYTDRFAFKELSSLKPSVRNSLIARQFLNGAKTDLDGSWKAIEMLMPDERSIAVQAWFIGAGHQFNKINGIIEAHRSGNRSIQLKDAVIGFRHLTFDEGKLLWAKLDPESRDRCFKELVESIRHDNRLFWIAWLDGVPDNLRMSVAIHVSNCFPDEALKILESISKRKYEFSESEIDLLAQSIKPVDYDMFINAIQDLSNEEVKQRISFRLLRVGLTVDAKAAFAKAKKNLKGSNRMEFFKKLGGRIKLEAADLLGLSDEEVRLLKNFAQESIKQ